MTHYCPTCGENRTQDEVEINELDPYVDSGMTSINVTTCLMCGEQVEDLEDYEGLTLEEFRD